MGKIIFRLIKSFLLACLILFVFISLMIKLIGSSDIVVVIIIMATILFCTFTILDSLKEMKGDKK